MTTQIAKSYRSGFFLNEQELRRLLQEVTAHAEKISQAEHVIKIKIYLRNGAVLDIDSTDDVFLLENDGQKRIQKIFIEVKPNDGDEGWELAIVFEDAAACGSGDPSVRFFVLSKSRDWAFVASSDIDERIKKLRKVSIASLLNQRIAFALGMLLSPIGMFVGLLFSPGRSKVYNALQQEYVAGKLKDPVVAIIEAERLRQSSFASELAPISAGLLLPLAFVLIGMFVVPFVSQPYNFYWGDYIESYKRRRRIAYFLWVVVVLGLCISIFANFISKRLGV